MKNIVFIKTRLLKKGTLTFLLLIIISTFFLRLYKISEIPYGLYIDETSIGYNAYSIVSTGKDEFGKTFPIFFQAFGEYKLPVYIYSVALTQIITGPTDFSVRFPALMYGVLSVFVMYFLAKELLYDIQNIYIKNVTPYLASLILGLSPWHYQFSRAGFESSAAIFFLILGLYFFFRSMRGKSSFYFACFILSFVMALYSYNSSRVVIPIIFFLLVALFYKSLRGIKLIYGFLMGFVIVLPYLFFAVSAEGLVRAKQVSIFYQTSDLPLIWQFVSNYWKNISPFYLFSKGDPIIAHLTAHRMSLIYLTDLPFFCLGFYYLIRKFSKVSFLIFSLLFISVVPSAISTLNPHSLRSSLAIPAVALICALGVVYCISQLKNHKRAVIFLACYFVVSIISTFKFINTYQNKYAVDSGWDWQAGVKSATKFINFQVNEYSDVYWHDSISKIAVLWYLKIPPEIYQNARDSDNILKHHFWTKYPPLPERNKKVLYVTDEAPNYGRLLENVYYPNGSLAYGIWEI